MDGIPSWSLPLLTSTGTLSEEPVNTELRPELIGYDVAVWHGQQIIYGVLESYNDYDVWLKYTQRLFESDNERGQWYTQLGDSKLVVEREKIAALQLK